MVARKKGKGKSECLEESIVDNAHIMMVVMNRSGTVSLWNRAAEAVTGYGKGEVIGSPAIWKLIYPDASYRNEVTARIKEVLRKRDYFENFETTIVTKNGEQRTISWNTRETSEGGQPRIITVGIDITEKRKAEQTVRSLNVFQESVIANANVWITVLDTKGKILLWNKAAEEMSGYSREEVIGNDAIWKLLYPDKKYRKEVSDNIVGIIDKNKYLLNFETRIRCRDGSEKIIWWNTQPLRDEHGKPSSFIAIGRDNTERRKSEQTIQSLNIFRESVIESAHVLMAVMDRKGSVKIWNRAAEIITGYTRDEVVGSSTVWKQLYPDPEYRRTVTTRIRQILSSKEYFENLDTLIVARDGTVRDISWNTREIKVGSTIWEIAIGRDITEQRKAEHRLAEMNSFNEGIIDNAHILISVLDPKGNVVIWNRAAEDVTGYSRNEVLGKSTVWKSLYPDPAYRRDITKKITSIIRSQTYFENLETTIVTKKGDQRIIAWNTKEIVSADGHHEIAIGRDITEQRKAERALVAYISEMAMRLKNPVEILRDNLIDLAQLTYTGTLGFDEIATALQGQARSASQIAANVAEFQKEVVEKNEEIPEAYRKFLSG